MDSTLSLLTRATGLMTLVLLTGSLALGTVTTGRKSGLHWPRFTLAALHRNISLLTVLFLGVHVSTVIIDAHAGIRWLDAVMPFLANDRPLWLGLGTTALDVLVATVATSMLRTRLSFRTWQLVHWSAYGSWAAALLHGVIFGDDSRRGWVIGLYVVCAATVVLTSLWRRRSMPPAYRGTHRRAATSRER